MIHERTEALLGKAAIQILKQSHVAVFGLGGVGSYATEALARSGVGEFTLVDSDVVSVSNINRQLIATHDTVGRLKTDVQKERILAINPRAVVHVFPIFIDTESLAGFDFQQFSYVVDAVDTVTAKLLLIELATQEGRHVISSMGAGNKLDPTQFEVADIFQTSVCPLAKVMRKELKKRGIEHLKVVYSKEEPMKPESDTRTPGSVAFVPSVAGLTIAGEVVKDLVGYEK